MKLKQRLNKETRNIEYLFNGNWLTFFEVEKEINKWIEYFAAKQEFLNQSKKLSHTKH